MHFTLKQENIISTKDCSWTNVWYLLHSLTAYRVI